MPKTGEIVDTHWYEFADGVFSFHTAHDMETMPPAAQVIRVPHNQWPAQFCADNGIKYTFMLNSSEEDIAIWLRFNPDKPVKSQQKIKILYEGLLVD